MLMVIVRMISALLEDLAHRDMRKAFAVPWDKAGMFQIESLSSVTTHQVLSLGVRGVLGNTLSFLGFTRILLALWLMNSGT